MHFKATYMCYMASIISVNGCPCPDELPLALSVFEFSHPCLVCVLLQVHPYLNKILQKLFSPSIQFKTIQPWLVMREYHYRKGMNFHDVKFSHFGEMASMLNFRGYKFSWMLRGSEHYSRH